MDTICTRCKKQCEIIEHSPEVLALIAGAPPSMVLGAKLPIDLGPMEMVPLSECCLAPLVLKPSGSERET